MGGPCTVHTRKGVLLPSVTWPHKPASSHPLTAHLIKSKTLHLFQVLKRSITQNNLRRHLFLTVTLLLPYIPRKVLDSMLSALKNRTAAENLYVVTEIVQLVNSPKLQDVRSSNILGKLLIPWNTIFKVWDGNTKNKASITIPASLLRGSGPTQDLVPTFHVSKNSDPWTETIF